MLNHHSRYGLLLGSILTLNITACTFDVSNWPVLRFDAGTDDAGRDAGSIAVDSGSDHEDAALDDASTAGTGGSTAGDGGVGGASSIGGQGSETQAGSGANPEPTAGHPGGGTGGDEAGSGEPGGQGGSVSPTDLLSLEVTTFSIANEQGFSTVASGETLLGSVTYHNPNDQPFTVKQIVIGGRPPEGTHAGGPYFDLIPILGGPTIIQPNESLTYSARRTMRVTDPFGVWEFYPTWQGDDNEWHDGESVALEVVLLPREDDQDGGI